MLQQHRQEIEVTLKLGQYPAKTQTLRPSSLAADEQHEVTASSRKSINCSVHPCPPGHGVIFFPLRRWLAPESSVSLPGQVFAKSASRFRHQYAISRPNSSSIPNHADARIPPTYGLDIQGMTLYKTLRGGNDRARGCSCRLVSPVTWRTRHSTPKHLNSTLSHHFSSNLQFAKPRNRMIVRTFFASNLIVTLHPLHARIQSPRYGV
jgi:hypothetical protein